MQRADIHVIGGTYLDIEIMLDAPLVADRSHGVRHSLEALGGPGYCYAMRMAERGRSVTLCTALGYDKAGCRAADSLNAAGVSSEFLGGDALDRAYLVQEPGGKRYSIGQRTNSLRVLSRCSLPEFGPIIVASPTPLDRFVRTDRVLDSTELFLAPHSRQIEDLLTWPHEDLMKLCDLARAICVSASDAHDGLIEAIPDDVLIVVTDGCAGGAYRENGEWARYLSNGCFGPMERTNGAGEAFFAAVVDGLVDELPVAAAISTGAQSAAAYLARLNGLLDEAAYRERVDPEWRRLELTAIEDGR